MRQLVVLPSASKAQALADYLLTLKIQTQLLQEAEGWGVWICDEDRVPAAREELAKFQESPDDPRFTTAARQAEEVRREQRRTEVEYDRRNRRFRRRIDGGPARRVTLLLIVTSVVLFFATSDPSPVVSPLARKMFFTTFTLTEDGSVRENGLAPIASGEVWRLATPIFIHFGPWHLLFNMMWLYVLGSQIETRRGPWRLLLLVLLLAAGSNLAQYYVGDLEWRGSRLLVGHSPLFGGMSGVVYGLFGYVLAKTQVEPKLGLTLHPQTVTWMLLWFVLCFVPAFQDLIGRVANVAHAAGLLGGVLLALVGYTWRHLRSD
jgi:GlpG protein